ncbi:MAG: DUF4962 domain-containing protein [Candidatus Hinthialibacter sp.]
MKKWIVSLLALIPILCALPASSQELKINDSPAAAGEWGFHPENGEEIMTTPPGFVWRPQSDAKSYEVQCSRESHFASIDYHADQIEYNVHTPPRTFDKGKWFWRFRFANKEGIPSRWSQVREFTIRPDARALPLPAKEDLIARIPKTHPRLFVRPEQMDDLRRRARTDLRSEYDELVAASEKILQNPPPTQEPPLYPEGMERKSEDWREMWWGNRTYTIRALNGAATLAFTRLLGGQEKYGQLARRILMECAQWDPHGSTGYRYNDEAGMPYNYYFSRTYTFVHDLLSDEEKAVCRQVMTERGREMYDHLCPRHLWRPYSSHSNRAWHFLGEAGIAFLGEIPEAEDWAWFAANVFTNVYPVWSDVDGGWHEGVSYWRSYIQRFTWWADVMRTAMNINAFDKPYFSQVGYYPMYLQPPGTHGGGFGDLCAQRRSQDNRGIMSIFAAQAQNPYWQWYVEANGGAQSEGGYIGFIRGALPKVEAQAPLDLPDSRCFWGTGQAMLNSNLLDANDNVEVIFKSSPFGTQSHGYESNNSFLLYAFGERLFIRTGRRDIYGSEHHQKWMWSTRSTNCITVNGEGQRGHSAEAQGRITEFKTSKTYDYVVGEAADAYFGKLERFTRRILFIKPDMVILLDELKAPDDASFEWRLHAPTEMIIHNQHDIRVENGKASCKVNFLWPLDLQISQTDQFDPPPRPRIRLTEYHLTAKTSKPQKEAVFVTVLRPHKTSESIHGEAKLTIEDEHYSIRVPTRRGEATALIQQDGDVDVSISSQ